MRGWNIVRTKPIGKTYGRAIPAFIHNGAYHFATIDAYADGSIDCWGFLDRALFAAKLRTGWVDMQPSFAGPRPNLISIFNLGWAVPSDTQWTSSLADLHELVERTIRELNTSMSGLIDMQGSDVEVVNGARTLKMGIADEKPYRKLDDGRELLGQVLPVFLRDTGGFALSQWFIYADGLTQFSTDGPLISLGQAASHLESGAVVLSVPNGAWVGIEGIGRFKVKDGEWSIAPAERIREARDELVILQGQHGAVANCIAAHEAYKSEPSESLRDQLRTAYEAVPKHLRTFCGDMDSRDGPIRQILYGDSADDGA